MADLGTVAAPVISSPIIGTMTTISTVPDSSLDDVAVWQSTQILRMFNITVSGTIIQGEDLGTVAQNLSIKEVVSLDSELVDDTTIEASAEWRSLEIFRMFSDKVTTYTLQGDSLGSTVPAIYGGGSGGSSGSSTSLKMYWSS